MPSITRDLGCWRRLLPLSLWLVSLVVSCGPGDGSSLDMDGMSKRHPWAPSLGSRFGAASFPATFGGIQKGFFVPICGDCHSGAAAPVGLDLAGQNTYELTVNSPSAEQGSLKVVLPNNPAESYLIQKLEGAPGISGLQMPRDRPARPEEEIDTIKQWIQEGAQRN